MFTREEIYRLKKYVKGNIIQKEDSTLIRNLQSMGLATGFHQEGNEVHNTSRLTSEGYDLFKSSMINYSPIKKFFSGLMASVY
ncbi:MAG: hypothetical protein ABIF18_00050 [archaeon]